LRSQCALRVCVERWCRGALEASRSGLVSLRLGFRVLGWGPGALAYTIAY